MKNEHDVISFTGNKMWLSIPAETRKKLERNVWCGSCRDTIQIENYIVTESEGGIVLEGCCRKCGNKVARVID